MASVPLPGVPAVFRGVSCRWFPCAGSATFLAPVSWPAPAVETCCWVSGVFGAPLGFLPCAVLFLWGLRFTQLALGGFSAFSVTGCLTYCYSGGVGWAATLPLYFCASPVPAGLQGFAGFCTLCQGAPVEVVSALWATV